MTRRILSQNLPPRLLGVSRQASFEPLRLPLPALSFLFLSLFLLGGCSGKTGPEPNNPNNAEEKGASEGSYVYHSRAEMEKVYKSFSPPKVEDEPPLWKQKKEIERYVRATVTSAERYEKALDANYRKWKLAAKARSKYKIYGTKDDASPGSGGNRNSDSSSIKKYY